MDEIYSELPVEVRDEAGVHRVLDATPDAEPITMSTELVADPAVLVDWTANVPLEGVEFIARTTKDAMGRPVIERRPDGSVLRAEYTDGGSLSALFVSTEDGQVPETEVLGSVSYSVMRQRESARLGNGVMIRREYERETQLVRRISATRTPQSVVELHYCRICGTPMIRLGTSLLAQTWLMILSAVQLRHFSPTHLLHRPRDSTPMIPIID